MFEIGFLGWLLVGSFASMLYVIGRMVFASQAQQFHDRVEGMHIFSSGSDEDKKRQESFLKRLQRTFEEPLKRYFGKHLSEGKLAPLEIKLKQAGLEDTPMDHWTKKFIYALAFGALGLVLGNIMGKLTLLFIGGLVLGFFTPDLDMRSKTKKRQLILKNEIADFLDLLAATAPSASNLEEAISKVCARMSGLISEEFRIALDEINAGSKSRVALSKMAQRCGVKEIETLISQINQSQAYGVGAEKTLVAQADKIRVLKKQLAEERAQKASVTLLLPSMFLLLTCLILIAGPSVVALYEAKTVLG